VIETGFVTPASPFSIEIHGTDGSLLFSEGTPMRLGTADGWEEIPLPEDAPLPFAQWVRAIREGGRTTENLERARALTELVVAANAAAR
jgi:predicted dehydrogenase